MNSVLIYNLLVLTPLFIVNGSDSNTIILLIVLYLLFLKNQKLGIKHYFYGVYGLGIEGITELNACAHQHKKFFSCSCRE